MKQTIKELSAALSEKGELLNRLLALLKEEQSCLTSLDLARLEEKQQQLQEGMERLAALSEQCRKSMALLAAGVGLPSDATLSPIVARLPRPEQEALREAQVRVAARSQALSGALALHRGLLEDSLGMVDCSVSFFNRLFNPGDTYGYGGAIVSRRGGSRFVCKEA